MLSHSCTVHLNGLEGVVVGPAGTAGRIDVRLGGAEGTVKALKQDNLCPLLHGYEVGFDGCLPPFAISAGVGN